MPGSHKWDGKSQDLSLMFGMNAPDGKGNVTGYFTYAHQDPVKQSERDYSACQLRVSAAGVPSCTGSSNSNIFYNASGDQLDLLINATGRPGQDGIPDSDTASVLGNSFIVRGSAVTSPPAIFNANPYEYLLQENTRYTAGFFANYKLNDNVELYSNFGFMDSVSNVNVGPSALFQGSGVTPSGGFLVNCNNPFLSAQQRGALLCSAADIAASAKVVLRHRLVLNYRAEADRIDADRLVEELLQAVKP